MVNLLIMYCKRKCDHCGVEYTAKTTESFACECGETFFIAKKTNKEILNPTWKATLKTMNYTDTPIIEVKYTVK